MNLEAELSPVQPPNENSILVNILILALQKTQVNCVWPHDQEKL